MNPESHSYVPPSITFYFELPVTTLAFDIFTIHKLTQSRRYPYNI